MIDWQADGSARFTISCTDGLYPVTQNYPRRTITRQCWKTFDDGIACPFSKPNGGQGAHGAALAALGGSPTSCDYFFNSPNGCLAHGMSPFFGGHPAQPQSVVIKDDGTGIIGGLFRSTVTSTSIVSDSIYGQPVPEIWCNDDGVPGNAFVANAIIVAVRDESTFMDLLGIVSEGPIGAFEGMSVQTTSDGYKFVVAPFADGFPPQGFSVNSQLQVTGYHPNMGLREVTGHDPVVTLVGTMDVSNANPSVCTWVSGTKFDSLGTGAEIYCAALGGFVIVGNVASPTSMTLSRQYTTQTATLWNAYPDVFSLGQGSPQTWDIPDPQFGNIQTGQANDILPFAAGTALCEVRYQKSPSGGITPTTTESHTLTVPISQGLVGVSAYDGSSTPGLTNPFWICVNILLRALGLQSASPSIQQQYYNDPFVGDGSGPAEIADLIVPVVLGTGTEKQFIFNGMLAEFKPVRDWFTEVLNCCLGYFTFEYGKLTLNTRNNASDVSAFTIGNILFQSLSLRPRPASFEYLKILFANSALQYQQDMADYQDKDHAAYYGRAGAPLTSQMRSVGISTISQALRIAVTRVREEIGGILRPDQPNPYIEWDNNNSVAFKSTILALDTSAGKVVSITHPEIPTYPGPAPGGSLTVDLDTVVTPNTWKFRVQKWMLHKDYSVTIQADSVTDSMYDLDVGPKPMDILPSTPPRVYQPQSTDPAWSPALIGFGSSDALFPGEYTFDLYQAYSFNADGPASAFAQITGYLPVNTTIDGATGPVWKNGKVTLSSTGGFIPGGITLRIILTQTVVKGNAINHSQPSDVLIVQIPAGTNTNSITIDGVTYPPDNGAGYNIVTAFYFMVDELICLQSTHTSGGGLPSTIVLSAAPTRSKIQAPNPLSARVRMRSANLVHGGIIGQQITAVSSTTLTVPGAIDSTLADNWTGRVVTVIGRPTPGSSIPPYSSLVTAFDPATGIFTVANDPTAGNPVLPDDVLVVCFLGYDNSSNPLQFTDSGLSNATNGHTGETPSDPNRIGNRVYVWAGTSRGLSAKIVDNSSTGYTLDRPLPLDATSVVIVLAPNFNTVFAESVIGFNADSNTTTTIQLPVDNFYEKSIAIFGSVEQDLNGTETDDEWKIVRLMYVFGSGINEAAAN